MSTERQRAQGRQKQKRWYEKNRDRVRAKRQYKNLLSPKIDRRHLRADFRTFELADPRDAPDLVTRLVGYCCVEQRPVWSILWALKGVSNARWAMWLRELEAVGLEPVELSGWAVGIAMPIKLRLARMLVASRLKQMCKMAMGDPRQAPPWLCNEIRVGGKGQCRRVGRVLPDGTVERFKSLREAGRAVGMSVDWLAHLAFTGGVDSAGLVWFDD